MQTPARPGKENPATSPWPCRATTGCLGVTTAQPQLAWGRAQPNTTTAACATALGSSSALEPCHREGVATSPSPTGPLCPHHSSTGPARGTVQAGMDGGTKCHGLPTTSTQLQGEALPVRWRVLVVRIAQCTLRHPEAPVPLSPSGSEAGTLWESGSVQGSGCLPGVPGSKELLLPGSPRGHQPHRQRGPRVGASQRRRPQSCGQQEADKL